MSTYHLFGFSRILIISLLFFIGGRPVFATELLVNGGFEDGLGWTNWTRLANGTNQTDSWWNVLNSNVPSGFSTAHTGTRHQYLGADINAILPANNVDGSLYQTVTIPTGTTAATLSYYLRIETLENPILAYDSLEVYIENSSGQRILTIVPPYTNLDSSNYSTWKYQYIDIGLHLNLSSLAGQQIRVVFHGITDPNVKTVFHLDDVSLQATVSPISPLPDLYISMLDINPVQAYYPFQGTISVNNSSSTITAGPSTLKVYLSTDRTTVSQFLEVGSLNYSTILPLQGSQLVLLPITLTNLSPGIYYACAIADVFNAVNESDKTNNMQCTTIPIVTIFSQTIIFPNPGTKALGSAPFTLIANGGASGKPVTFRTQTSSICTVSGSTVTLVAAGTCTIAADQADNRDTSNMGYANYAAAPQVTQSFTVTASAPAPAPAVSLGPTPLTFTNQAVGTTSAARTVTLTNTGNATLLITSIASNNSVYGVTNNCAGSRVARDYCTLSVTYSPTSVVSTLSTITVISNAPGSPHYVQLNGNGIPAGPPVCILTPAPPTVARNGTSVLTASCTNSPTSYTWTGGTCAGTTAATCTVTPAVTTPYGVTGTNSAGSGAASATVTVRAIDLTPILMLLLD